MKPKELSALLLLAALWGASFLFYRITVPSLGTFLTVALRVLIAAFALLIYARVAKQHLTLRQYALKFLVLGLLNAVIPYALIAWAELRLTASLASILNATTPLFTAIATSIYLGEKYTPKRLLGFPLGILGVAILVGWSPQGLSLFVILSMVAILLASLSYGIATVYAKTQFKGVSSLTMATGQQLGATLWLFIPAGVTLPQTFPSATVVFSVLALALFCTALAYLLYFFLVTNVGPVKTVSVTYLVPVFGTLWGLLFLREHVTLSMIVGLFIILSSVVFINDVKLPKLLARDSLDTK
jgi:drug/metabolite transporter (DMT)-like permease